MLYANDEKEVSIMHQTSTLMEGVKPGHVKWNQKLRETTESMRNMLRPGQELFVELAPHGLIIIKCGVYYSVSNGERVIVDRCTSVTVLENGWIVVFKYGRYNLFYKDGSEYKGAWFLNKKNLIRFAKTL